MHRLKLLFLFSFLFSTGFCQRNKELHGIVLDNHSKAVLAGASILLYHSGNITGLVANKEGRFEIGGTAPFDSIRVSMIGYHSAVLSFENLNNSDLSEILLVAAPSLLNEVVIKPVNPIEVVKKVIANIPANQPQTNFENNGFYREIIKDKENYFSIAEAVFQSQYFPAAKNYKLKLIRGRSKEDVSYTRLFEDFHPGGGPQAVAGSGFVINVPSFLNNKDINKFNYKIDSVVEFDGRQLYHISFDQKDGVKEALDKGYMLIDMDDYAVVCYEIHNSPEGTPYIKNLTGTDKIFAALLNIDLKRKGWHTRVDFTKIDDKWIMSHAETEYAISYKQPKKHLDLDLTVNIELLYTDLFKTVNKEISKEEEWKKKDIVADLPTAFDETFWGNKNIISPTQKVKDIIAAISKNNNDLPVANTLSDWKYLNPNLFLTYKQNDTIILIPIMKCYWKDEAQGGMIFHELDDDFVIESKITVTKNSADSDLPDRGFQQAGIMVRSADGPKENYIMLSLGTGGNSNPKIFLKRTSDSKSKTEVNKLDNMTEWLRIEKSGNKITAFFRAENDMRYKKIDEYDLAWLGGKLEVGLATFAAFSGDGPKMKPDMKAVFSQFIIHAK